MGKRRSSGEGSIFQRHEKFCPPPVDGQRPAHRCKGHWVATLDLGYHGGKRRRKVLYANTQKEARIKLATALRDHDAGALVTAAPTVEKWVRYWLDNIAADEVRPLTLTGYRSKVNNYIIPNLGRERLDKLAPEHIRAMYATMRADGLAEATLRQTHAILRKALKDATREGKLARNPAELVKPPGTQRERREPLSVADARRVLTAAGDDPRWHLALYLGMRQGEALGLRWSDVDLDTGVLYVRQTLQRVTGRGLVFGRPKSRASTRALPLPTVVASRLAVAWAAHVAAGGDRTGLVFTDNGHPVDPRKDWQRWTDLLERAGVGHVPLHAARNTAASLLESVGIPVRVVSEILGHSQVQITHAYQSADLDQHRTAMLALEAHLSTE